MRAFLVSFGVVFLAELGDKSQLLALSMAARFRALPVLAGVAAATALLFAISVGVGAAISELPTRPIQFVAGIVFLGFAAWTLRSDATDERELARTGRSVVLTVATALFVAELGDKTMLAAITLATQEGALGVWAGATTGMITADALAIVVGNALGARLPERALRVGAAVAFVVFGAVLLADALRG